MDHKSCEEMFEALSLVVDGESAEARCREVLAHVGDCPPCRRYLESLRATREALAAAGRTAEMSPEETASLLEDCRKALRERCPDIVPEKPSP